MSATLSITDTPAPAADADAVVIAVCKGPDGPVPGPGASAVDEAMGGRLAAALSALGATGEVGEVTRIWTGGSLTAPVVAATGVGAVPGDPGAPLDPERLRRAAGAVVRTLTSGDGPTRPERIALALPARDEAEAEAVALGALLGAYQFRRYRGGKAGQIALTLLAQPAAAQAAVRRAEVLAAAVDLVRDLVNTSPSHLTPADFAVRAEQVATGCGLWFSVLDEQALADGGYGGILGVGKGSAHPPRLVRLEYAPAQAARTLVLAGKGITFDTGGISLKTSKQMETMKSDMAGAAAVLGAMQAIAALGLPVRVVGYLPLAENMPSGTAQRPSDVLTAFGGTTVEVLNTDAEGRLVLADALAAAAADSPDLLIDVATLTGAQVVALGSSVAGVMASDDTLAAAVADAARRAGDQAWPMPLPDELRKGLDSAVADLTNVAPDRNGGMLVAGLFLREFVPDGVRWAHLDIAGPAFNSGPPHGYTPKGGTGAATRALVQVAQDMADGRL